MKWWVAVGIWVGWAVAALAGFSPALGVVGGVVLFAACGARLQSAPRLRVLGGSRAGSAEVKTPD